jgi:TolA-binding protein
MGNDKTKTFITDNWKNILLLIFFFVIIALVMSTTCTSRKLDIAENNLKAMNDTLHTYKLRNGELMYAKQGYIARIGELEQYIDVKEKEIKELEKKLKSKVATISKLQEQIRLDSIHMHDSTYITQDSITHDSIYHSHFTYNDNWTVLDGETTFRFDPFNTHTIINNLTMQVPLKVGTTEDNQWFAISDNPHVRFTSIEGANITKAKPKKNAFSIHAGVGAGVGYGVCIPPSGGTVNSGIILGPVFYVGLGYSRTILEF